MEVLFIKKVLMLVLVSLTLLLTVTTLSATNTTSDAQLVTHDDTSTLNDNQDIQSDTNKEKTLKTAQAKNKTKITVSNKTVYVGKNVGLVATVVDQNTKGYVAGGKVAFKVNGITVGVSTITNGKAYYTYSTKNLSPGTYKLQATYGGTSSLYTSQAQPGYLKIQPLATKISVAKVTSTSKKVTLKATIVDSTNNKYIDGGKVAFKINGKTIGYSNITNGKASIGYDASGLYGGSYNITVKYGGTKTNSAKEATGKLVITVPSSFTFNQVKDVAVGLRTKYEANNIVNYVYISSSKIAVQDFLPMLAQAVVNIKSGKASQKIAYHSYAAPTSQNDTIKKGNIYTTEIVSLSNRILNHMSKYKTAPRYVPTSRGNLGYYNMIYTLCKVMDVSTSKYLVDSCKLYNWKTIHPSNPKSRHIYISSDNIYNKAKDKAFVNQIKSILESRGYKVSTLGIGPNTHNVAMWDGSLPDNAVQLSLFGGADAGVIYDVCTRSYMRTKSNRLVFFAYHAGTSLDITDRAWLKRAHDDNYSPSSFKGIANPDDYLRSHGYDYVYSSSPKEIADALIAYIS